MGAIKDGLKVTAWITDRIDQVAKYFKKKGRVNEVNKIDSSVDSRDTKSVNNILRGIKKKSEDRIKSSS